MVCKNIQFPSIRGNVVFGDTITGSIFAAFWWQTLFVAESYESDRESRYIVPQVFIYLFLHIALNCLISLMSLSTSCSKHLETSTCGPLKMSLMSLPKFLTYLDFTSCTYMKWHRHIACFTASKHRFCGRSEIYRAFLCRVDPRYRDVESHPKIPVTSMKVYIGWHGQTWKSTNFGDEKSHFWWFLGLDPFVTRVLSEAVFGAETKIEL